MLSLTPITAADNFRRAQSSDIDHFLGRAERESIAALRATDGRVAASHCTMARHYSAKAVALLEAAAA